MDRASIIGKIAKCLKLTKSNNEFEAAAALRQAQALMQKYGVTDTDILAADVTESKASTGSRNNPPCWITALANLISHAFGVKHILLETTRTNQFIFIGSSPATDVASYAFTVLRRKVTVDRKAYFRRCRGKLKNRTRRADIFATFWVEAVSQTVYSFAKPLPKKTLDRYLAEHHPNLFSYKPRQSKLGARDINTIVDGLDAGRDIKLHQAMNGVKSRRIKHG